MTAWTFGHRPRAACAALFSAALLCVACQKTPDEPEAGPTPTATAPAVQPLAWETPSSWAVQSGRTGAQKATYKVARTGNDKEDASIDVLFFGTGNAGDPKKVIDEWFGQFDGDVGAKAARESFDVRGMKVETVEVEGTYKVPLGPPIGPNKKTPMQMVKEHFRLYGAVVRTPDRGNWFFKMTGPDETVQSARSGMRALLESVK